MTTLVDVCRDLSCKPLDVGCLQEAFVDGEDGVSMRGSEDEDSTSYSSQDLELMVPRSCMSSSSSSNNCSVNHASNSSLSAMSASDSESESFHGSVAVTHA